MQKTIDDLPQILEAIYNNLLEKAHTHQTETTESKDLIRIFSKWSAISPIEFIQGVSKNSLKQTLSNSQKNIGSHKNTVFRLIEMDCKEYKNLQLSYGIYETIYGRILIASGNKGVCLLIFVDEEKALQQELKRRYPNATYILKEEPIHHKIVRYINDEISTKSSIPLYVWGTPFQVKVWKALLGVPEGELLTYGDIARQIGTPQAYRAVGTAVGSNPISLLIPCHRIIRSTGIIGHYHWGKGRKIMILGREQMRASKK